MNWDNESIVKQIQTGQGNRNELLERLWTDNLGLIRKIIHELTGLDREKWSDIQDFEDLEQQAFLGIMDCITHFDSAKGTKFFTFATPYIKKSVYRYYDRAGQALRIPAYMRKRIRDYMGEREQLQGKGLPAMNEMIQENLKWSDIALRETLMAIQKLELQRLDSYLNESDKESGTILDMLSSIESTSETATESVHDKELHVLIRSAIQELPEMEKNIITARHFQKMGNAQIANTMNCTRQNVSQYVKSAYKRIRTGKYGKELATFLPERASHRAEKSIQDEFKELSEQERELLL